MTEEQSSNSNSSKVSETNLEEKLSDSSSSKISVTDSFLCLTSLSAGMYHGYCDVQGIPFEKENTEWLLTYGPAVVRGVFGAVTGAAKGLASGGEVLENTVATKTPEDSDIVMAISLGSVFGAGIGGIYGAGKGGIETLLGYGIGYVAGYVTK